MKKHYKIIIAIYSKKNNKLGTIKSYVYCENHKVAKQLVMKDYKQLSRLDNVKYKLESISLDLEYGKSKSTLPF